MRSPPPHSPIAAAGAPPRISPGWGVAVLWLAAVAAYWNGLGAPFTFDDLGAVTGNPSIRQFATMFAPPPQAAGAVGRPLVNASLALNYALGGDDVRGYHAFNLAVHLLAAAALFGLLRRTLARPGAPGAGRADAAAFAVALLWAVHPLQTESVMGVVQRSELLVGLFYLLALYGFVRGAGAAPAGAGRWYALAIAAAILGAFSKEVIVTLPLLAWLWDRTFFAGSFAAAWRARRWVYVGLFASWLPLGLLVLHHGRRTGTAGFGLGVSPWHYLLTQCDALVRYLGLVVWPHPLIVDYGTTLIRSPSAVIGQGLLVLALLGATLWALVRRPALGLAGAAFFLILAPSSSVVPLVSQTIAEHRMYLPLAAVLAPLVVLALSGRPRRWQVPVLIATASLLTGLTVGRNRDYRSELSLWTDTVAHRPDNARARQNLGVLLAMEGRTDEAVPHYEAALRLNPDFGDAHFNLAQALLRRGETARATPHFEAAIRAGAYAEDAHFILGNLALAAGRTAAAIAHFTEAVRLRPGYADAHTHLANTLAEFGRFADAIAHYRAALGSAPERTEIHFNLGVVLLRAGLPAEAVPEFEAVLRLSPDDAAALRNLARARAATQ